jgi:hypothetical protein
VEFFHVDTVAGQGPGDLPHDSWTILADDFQSAYSPAVQGCLRLVRVHHHDQPARSELLERQAKGLGLALGHLDPQNSGKMTTQTGHAALKPIAFVPGDECRDGFNQAKPVLAD